ncbi:MAG: hypothetical protein QNJ40_10815 [Xanthomonadales bacterium]|nr:hypothetical protein [Xanthomonadales bacterium]
MKALVTFILIVCLYPGIAMSTRDMPLTEYVIEITSATPGTEVEFKGAIGAHGELELIEETTPVRKPLKVFMFTAIFQALSAEQHIHVVLHERIDGELTKGGSFTGNSGRVYVNPADELSTKGFGAF